MPEIAFDAVDHAGLTDVGVRRSHNQDAFAAQLVSEPRTWQERGHLFLVADGMGGHAVGELASKMAADLIPHTYLKYAGLGPTQAITRAFAEANVRIHERGQQNPEFEGTGTTSTALILRPDGAWIGHVGDSRVYRVRGDRIEQLSFDHSFQWELARRQRVHPDQINVPHNVIVRSLGPESEVEIDIEGPHPIMPGDIYLLCSDGLSNQVHDEELGAVVRVFPPKEACRFLVDLANLRGGPDNITALIVHVPGESPDAAMPPSNPALMMARWYHRLPWPGIALGAGITLALVAIVAALLSDPLTSLITFVLAGASLLLGIIGLLRAHIEERRREAKANGESQRVYVQTSCRLDAAMADKLTQAQTKLEEGVREKSWQVDWEEHRSHVEQARQAAARQDWSSAAREQCRAMGVLMAAARQQRVRGEVFQPLWEKPRSG